MSQVKVEVTDLDRDRRPTQVTLIGKGCLILVSLFIILAATGCGHHETPAGLPPAVPSALPPVTIIPAAPTSHKSLAKVTIYRLAETSTEIHSADENGLVPVSISIPIDCKTPASDAVRHLIVADGSPIPDGTKLIGIKIDDNSGLATLNFSKDFIRNFRGGDRVEAQIINSLRATLGQFSNIQNMQILVAGKKFAQLGGTLDMSEPLPVIRLRASNAALNKGI